MNRTRPDRKADLTGLACTAGMGLLILLAWMAMPGPRADGGIVRHPAASAPHGRVVAPPPVGARAQDPLAAPSGKVPAMARAPGA